MTPPSAARSPPRRCFNGAAALWLRMTSASSSSSASPSGLQWGRSPLAADDKAIDVAQCQTDRLQWGRSPLAADDAVNHWEVAVATHSALQWGRSPLAADDVARPDRPAKAIG